MPNEMENAGDRETWKQNRLNSTENRRRSMPRRTVIEAKVVNAEKRTFPRKHYVYVIHVTWSDNSVNVIYRRYSAFFDFQVKLLMKYPEEAGSKNPQQRSIPFIPGKKLLGRSHTREVATKRQKPLNDYCSSLVRLPTKISESKEVIDFFTPTQEDINPPKEKDSGQGGDKSDRRYIEEITGPIQSETYVVIADYKKGAKNEVSLKEGEQVEVLEKGDNGWWFISVHDAQGWAPGTFMQREDGKEEDDFIVGNSEKYISNTAYEAQQEDELSFDIGAVVEVVKKSLDGWWVVKYLNEQGWVPAAYLQPYKGPDRSSVKPSPATQLIGSIMDIGKKTIPQTEAQNMFLKGPQSASGLQLDNKKKPTPPRRGTVKRSLKGRGSGAIRKGSRVPMEYYTIEDYDNHVGDGISFKKDKPVEVLERSSSGWWLVKISGEEGWVPASYIDKKPSRGKGVGENESKFINNNTVSASESKPKMGGHAFQPYSKEIIQPKPVKPTIPERPVQLGGTSSTETNQFAAARAQLKPAVPKKQSDSGDELNEEVKKFTNKVSGPNAYITVSCFEKEDVEGIGFKEGVTAEVLEKHESGWWLVRIGDEEGWAPSSFLQKL